MSPPVSTGGAPQLDVSSSVHLDSVRRFLFASDDEEEAPRSYSALPGQLEEQGSPVASLKSTGSEESETDCELAVSPNSRNEIVHARRRFSAWESPNYAFLSLARADFYSPWSSSSHAHKGYPHSNCTSSILELALPSPLRPPAFDEEHEFDQWTFCRSATSPSESISPPKSSSSKDNTNVGSSPQLSVWGPEASLSSLSFHSSSGQAASKGPQIDSSIGFSAALSTGEIIGSWSLSWTSPDAAPGFRPSYAIFSPTLIAWNPDSSVSLPALDGTSSSCESSAFLSAWNPDSSVSSPALKGHSCPCESPALSAWKPDSSVSSQTGKGMSYSKPNQDYWPYSSPALAQCELGRSAQYLSCFNRDDSSLARSGWAGDESSSSSFTCDSLSLEPWEMFNCRSSSFVLSNRAVARATIPCEIIFRKK